MITASTLDEFNRKFEQQTPQAILQAIFADFDNIAISFSGAEDVALVVMAWKLNKNIKVFSLDTGRLHPETYRFIERIRTEYDIPIEILVPEAAAVEQLVNDKGLFSFYQDGHDECCGIRKIQPLRKKLAGLGAWITGQRRDQSPTRAEVPIAQLDTTFSGSGKHLFKFNPLANQSSADVWNYIRLFDVPYNPLHDQGFVSIGCEPCTRAIGPNQHEREGRWWWEESTLKECGLHKGNRIASDSQGDNQT
ncbi:MAG: phosphoadenylyl-sulfate reductase [Pseudomonadales bacterium]|nr:phosphoadenylyl-sulfate reductase [Pseudomonadales bacterium]